MSMIMYVARGTAAELVRLADYGGDDGSLPPAFERLMTSRRAALANMPPEIRAQLVERLRTHPQFGGLAPQVLEWVERGLSVVPPSAPAANGTAHRQNAVATASRPETIDLHKSWHVLHYLLSGRAGEGGTPPSNFLMQGGREVGEDTGYGPSRLLEPSETAAVARFIGGLSVAELMRRIDAPRMAALDIYCAGEGSPDDAEELADDVELYFPRLQAHYRAAAQARQSTLLWLS